MWSIPYAQSPPREDVDKAGSFCMVYDVIFHPETLIMARKDRILREKLEQTAMESVETSFKVTLDKNNIKRPKLRFGDKIQFQIYYSCIILHYINAINIAAGYNNGVRLRVIHCSAGAEQNETEWFK